MTNKLTNKKALTIAIDSIADYCSDGTTELTHEGQTFAVEDIISKLRGMVDALDAKAAGAKRKPTAKQSENEGFKVKILEFMRANPNRLLTCTEIGKEVPELNGLNNQRISALMRGLVDAGLVDKTTEKGKSLFSAVVVEIEGEGD